MSTDSQEQEIDLGQLSKKIGDLFQKLIDSFFDFILFLKRNIIIVATLFILGIVLGYFLDKKTKEYDHEIVVLPNFGSVDYLYSKIKLINSKRKEGDTLFLKSIGIKQPKELGLLEVEPIIDVYSFIQQRESNFDLIKLMAEDGDLDKIIENETTSKNYPFHLIKIKTRKAENRKEFIDPIMNYLESSDYFSSIQKEMLSSLKIEIASNEETITQINNILNEFNNTTGSNSKSDKLIYYNENNQLNDVIKSKEEIIKKLTNNRVSLINYQKTIKEVTSTLNIKDTKGTNGKLKLVLPFLFVFLFLMVVFISKFYKSQMSKRNLV
jgi:preprotein translocase subunit SecG